MSPEQVREVAGSGLVEIASHSHDLHRDVVYTPQGNSCWAAASRIYDPVEGTYETDDAFSRRLQDDFIRTREALRALTGTAPRTLVWPYGMYNQIGTAEAKKAGFEITLALEDKVATVHRIDALPRYIVSMNPPVIELAGKLKTNLVEPAQQRVLQADLDLIYDDDPGKREKNLDAFIERVCALHVGTVYLQAFCDENGDGNISSVYFPNRVLPLRADFFSRVVNQLAIRNVNVYAWMPMLSIVLPDKDANDRLRVREFSAGGGHRLSRSWYQRLSPFCPEAVEKLEMLYGDMAANARIAGVLFQDDGYLSDAEDFHPDARAAYRAVSGGDTIPFERLTPSQKKEWTRVKTATLTALSTRLMNAVRRYRPNAVFARNYYAPALLDLESEEWLAQNYAEGLRSYDYVVIMAYPFLEEVKRPDKWFKELVRRVREYPGGLEKTVFKVQSYDWKKKKWVSGTTMDRWLRTLVAAGARNIGYYPDNYQQNRPDAAKIQLMMSEESFPFTRIEQ
jgi:biofilm PGA synthesis lipoprotein PgaB